MATFEEVFGELDFEETLNEIRMESFEGAKLIDDKLNYQEGWYNYSTVTFDYRENRYSVMYRDHVSDNVSNFEYVSGLKLIGKVSELTNTITMECLAEIKYAHEKEVEKFKKEISKLQEYKNALKPIRKLSTSSLKNLSEAFTGKSDDHEEIKEIGVALKSFYEMRKNKLI